MTNPIYNVDWFLAKFEAIPEEKWCTHALTIDDRHCAQGHCGMTQWPDNFFDSIFPIEKRTKNQEWIALYNLFGRSHEDKGIIVANVNNGNDPRYQQPTPKQRILAALRDLKKLEQPEVKTVYVTVDAEVRELQKKELSVN